MITKDSYEGELKKFRKYCRKHPNELGCYVYALADPTKGKEQVFYVGKGQKERMFNHILSSFKHKELSEEQLVGEKLERIQRVHNFGHKVKMYILHYGLTNEHAFIVESVLIDVFSNFKVIDDQAIGDLTNGIYGFNHRRGFCDVDTLCNNANVREKIHVLPEEKILVIKISGTESSDADILERVRKSWRINPERANKATYIAACRNGVIIGLYTNSSGWLPVQLIESQNDEGRFYFEGASVTDKSVLERYINRIVEIPKGARYPILYVGGWK